MGAASAIMRRCAMMQMSCESDASALENSRGRAAVQAELAMKAVVPAAVAVPAPVPVPVFSQWWRREVGHPSKARGPLTVASYADSR